MFLICVLPTLTAQPHQIIWTVLRKLKAKGWVSLWLALTGITTHNWLATVWTPLDSSSHVSMHPCYSKGTAIAEISCFCCFSFFALSLWQVGGVGGCASWCNSHFRMLFTSIFLQPTICKCALGQNNMETCVNNCHFLKDLLPQCPFVGPFFVF